MTWWTRSAAYAVAASGLMGLGTAGVARSRELLSMPGVVAN